MGEPVKDALSLTDGTLMKFVGQGNAFRRQAQHPNPSICRIGLAFHKTGFHQALNQAADVGGILECWFGEIALTQRTVVSDPREDKELLGSEAMATGLKDSSELGQEEPIRSMDLVRHCLIQPS